MNAAQADLFATPSRTGEPPSDEIIALIRARLHAALTLVKAAEAMLWAEFDAEMDRLHAVMNEGKKPDLGD